jgi:hypothetical protein
MINFLRKLFLIDLLRPLIRSGEPPHLRFATFLRIFSSLWLVALALICLQVFRNLWAGDNTSNNGLFIIGGILLCGLFFFLYRHTAGILRRYPAEEEAPFQYLRYINPIAPVIYFTTFFFVLLLFVNIFMVVLLVLGFIVYLLGILVTLGNILSYEGYEFKNFTAIPAAFFNAERYVLFDMASPYFFIGFLCIIYLIIPLGTSFMILAKHYKGKK